MNADNPEDIARLRELRSRAVEWMKAHGRGLTFPEQVKALQELIDSPGVPDWHGITTAYGLAQWARRAVKPELAPREPETPASGDQAIPGGQRRRIIKGEMPGQSKSKRGDS